MIGFILSLDPDQKDLWRERLEDTVEGIHFPDTLQQYIAETDAPFPAEGALVLCDSRVPAEAADSLILSLKQAQIPWKALILDPSPDDEIVFQAITRGYSGVISACWPETQWKEMIKRIAGILENEYHTDLIVKAFRQQHFALVGQCMRGLLGHARNGLDFEYMERLGEVPFRNRLGWLVLIHVTNREENLEIPPTVLSMETSITAAKMFAEINEMQVMCYLQNEIFALFLQNRDYIEPEWAVIRDKLAELRNEAENRYCRMNMYAVGPIPLGDSPRWWPELESCMADNISMKEGIFHLSELHRPTTRSYKLQCEDLRRLIVQGYGDMIETRSLEMLRDLEQSNSLNHEALRDFHQQYMQMVFSVMWEKGWNTNDLFKNEEEQSYNRNAEKNVAHMRQLIHHISEFFRERFDNAAPPSTVQLVCRYIEDHFHEPLSREILANYVHLNPDYLSRIFRRETGMSLNDWITGKRMEGARMLLQGTRMRISEVAGLVGYDNFSYFSQNYRKTYGVTPNEERKKLRIST